MLFGLSFWAIAKILGYAEMYSIHKIGSLSTSITVMVIVSES